MTESEERELARLNNPYYGVSESDQAQIERRQKFFKKLSALTDQQLKGLEKLLFAHGYIKE